MVRRGLGLEEVEGIGRNKFEVKSEREAHIAARQNQNGNFFMSQIKGSKKC